MKKLMTAAAIVLAFSTLTASAQLMEDEKFAMMGACGEGIERFCPNVATDSLDAVWGCLAPHFDQINPRCKAVLQEIQDE